MKAFHCDHCLRPITPANPGIDIGHVHSDAARTVTDIRPAHLCGLPCLRAWLAKAYPSRRPDFAAARLAARGPVTSLPVPAGEARRIDRAELEADEEYAS